MNLLQLQNSIEDLMTAFVLRVRSAAALGKTDINKVSETILIPLFREVYGYTNLKNLNNTEGDNYPGIDLGDEIARVALQITSTSSSKKVKETLRKFVDYDLYKKYDKLIIYILTEKQNSYSGKGYKEIIQGKFNFDKDTDIIDYRDILSHIRNFQIDRARKVESLLKENFGYLTQETELTNLIDWQNLWQQICCEVLEKQNQWLTSHALGSGNRRVSDMYVPLELVERKQPPRLDPNIPPEKGSEYYHEKRTPIKHEDFFEQVLKQGISLESNGRRIAIIGEPGAGKTTLLQEIASRVEGLPIWVDLAELNPQLEDCLENYLLQKWLDKKASSVIRRLLPEVVLSQEELKTAFKEAFYQNPVWLVLDGVNEIPANLSNPLTWIDKQIREGWISEARVVLTCRLNVGDIHNDLPGFDIYCNRDFSYPEQVEEFIDKWFVKTAEQESRDNLKAELRRANERIQNLIKNPLRLMLLCHTWEDGVKLENITKAELYHRLVKGLYKLKDRDNNPKFKIDRNQQEELNRKLGKLALQAIDGKDARFRLRESSIEELLGYPDQENSLFWIARELGLLNQVGQPTIEEKDSDERVYAFFHPTFQEYFAAKGIDDWDFFLLREHIDRPVRDKDNPGKYKRYRIFEPQWKEVILLWLGRKDLPNQEKERFIKNLMEFEDGCGLPNFYGALCYFIAAAGTSEFLECPETMAIMDELIKFAFGEFDFERWKQTSYLHPIALGSIEALQNMPHDKLVEKLIPIMDLNSCNNLPVKPAHLLWQSDCTNTELIISLIKLLGEKTKDPVSGYHWLFGNFLNNRDTKKIIAKVPVILHSLIESLIKKTFNGEHSLSISVINAFRNPWLKSSLPTSSTLIPSVLEDFLSGNLDNYLRLPVLAERISRNPDILDSLLYLLEYWDDIVVIVCNWSKPSSIERKNITLNKRLKGQDKNDFYQTSGYKEEFSNIENIDYIEIAGDNDIIEIEVMEMASQLISILQNTKYGVENENWLRHDTDMLMDILKNDDYYDSFPENAVINIKKYDRKLLDTWVIKGIKYCLSEKVCKEDLIRFKYCYEIVWYCAQNMSYPDFYQAWHCEPSTSHPEVDNIPVGNSPEAQTLEAQNLDFNELQPTDYAYPLAINLLSCRACKLHKLESG